jgi:hypothetical protein
VPIDEQHERCVGGEKRCNEQVQEHAAQAQWRPSRSIKHPVIRREMALCAQSDRAQRSGYRPPARGEQHAGDQDLHMLEGRSGKDDGKSGEQGSEALGYPQQVDLPRAASAIDRKTSVLPASKRLWNDR